MEANKVKKEHYVPQAYLNCFSRNTKIYVYDKSKDEIRHNQDISQVAHKRYFYDFSENEINILKRKYPEISEQYIEKELFSKRLEPNLKNLICKIEKYFTEESKEYLYLLSDELKANVSMQMAYQFLRTYGIREHINPDRLKTKALAHKMLLLETEGIIKELALFFYSKKWSILSNGTYIPLITSDNPVSIFNMVTGDTGLKALEEDGLKMIFYPLSSKIIINLMDEQISTSLNELKIGRVPLNEDFSVKFINTIQTVNAYNYVFYQSEVEHDFFRTAHDKLFAKDDIVNKWGEQLDRILNAQIEAINKGDFSTNQEFELILNQILEDFK